MFRVLSELLPETVVTKLYSQKSFSAPLSNLNYTHPQKVLF